MPLEDLHTILVALASLFADEEARMLFIVEFISFTLSVIINSYNKPNWD